jgi:ribonuclease Z
MPELIILGSSDAVPSAEHDSTHMVLVGRERCVLVDCSGTPVVRLKQAGLDPNRITDVVITHFHPDHVGGLPLLLLDLWLMGRREPLAVRGLSHALERVKTTMGLYGWENWPNLYEIEFIPVAGTELAKVIDTDEFLVSSSPVRHLIPTIGLRVDFPGQGSGFAYSADTAPCEEVVRLAEGTGILFHDTAGEGHGHSSATQAGEIAARAKVGALYLIHYPTREGALSGLTEAAATRYKGKVALATDFMTFEFASG